MGKHITTRQKYAKYGCYMANVTMAVIANISPLFFITFHNMYGISFSLLGLLVLFNFVTQLCIDLVFSFYSHLFNIKKTLRTIPVLTLIGMAIYAILPQFFPKFAFALIALGTVIFSSSAGLAEVLLSPVIAALPSDNPERDMSIAHSTYAWGVAFTVLVTTVLIKIFGAENWWIISLGWSVIPFSVLILFLLADIPELETPKNAKGTLGMLKNPILPLCVLCIFCGGSTECTMAQWCSGYLEAALGISKMLGDIFGVVLFAVVLGLGRTLYGKFGSRISRFLLLGFIGSAVCYLIATLVSSPIIGLLACGLTGFCASMLWPGTLILTSELIPYANVAVYALLAAGGDFGGSVGSQLVGSLADFVSESVLVEKLGFVLTPEQLGLKVGLLAAAFFPIVGIVVVSVLRSKEKKIKKEAYNQR